RRTWKICRIPIRIRPSGMGRAIPVETQRAIGAAWRSSDWERGARPLAARARLDRVSGRGLATAPGPGRGGALGLDAFQQHAGRLVVRVLGHQLATEGLG